MQALARVCDRAHVNQGLAECVVMARPICLPGEADGITFLHHPALLNMFPVDERYGKAHLSMHPCIHASIPRHIARQPIHTSIHPYIHTCIHPYTPLTPPPSSPLFCHALALCHIQALNRALQASFRASPPPRASPPKACSALSSLLVSLPPSLPSCSYLRQRFPLVSRSGPCSPGCRRGWCRWCRSSAG